MKDSFKMSVFINHSLLKAELFVTMNHFIHELKTSPLYVHGARLHLFGAAVLRYYSIHIQTWL